MKSTPETSDTDDINDALFVRSDMEMDSIPGSNIRSAISIAQIMKRVIDSGKITRADESFLMRAMTADVPLSDEDIALLQGVMKRLDLGLIKIAD